VYGSDLTTELALVKANDATEAVNIYNRTMRVPGQPVAQFAAVLQW
jgi:hypothetical protein